MNGTERRSYQVKVGAPIAIFVAILLLIGLTFVLQRGWEMPESSAVQPQEERWQAERNSGNDPLILGSRTAPVELVVFSDYQCPFCAHWSRETLPALLGYVDDEQLRIVWRDVNLSGEASERGARAVYAAALQDHFLDFHQALTEGGRGSSDDDLDEQSLIELADELGLDVPRFIADMRSPEAANAIYHNEAEGQSQGVTRTPSFLFDDQFISGVQPTNAFITNLEAALKEQEEGAS